MGPNDISCATDNAIFKNRAQNIECNFGCVPFSAVLLKANAANILLFKFCEQNFVHYGQITMAINWTATPLNQNPYQTATGFGCVGFLMYAWGFSVPQMRQFCLFTYLPRSEWASSEKMIFFWQNRHLLLEPFKGALSEATTHCMVN